MSLPVVVGTQVRVSKDDEVLYGTILRDPDIGLVIDMGTAGMSVTYARCNGWTIEREGGDEGL